MIWEEIGRRIKMLRHDKKLTQEQFGKLIGKSTQYVGRIERGQKISVDLITTICKKTGVTTDYIILGIINHCGMDLLLDDFSPQQIELCLDVIKRVTELIRTPSANNLFIKELMRRQLQPM